MKPKKIKGSFRKFQKNRLIIKKELQGLYVPVLGKNPSQQTRDEKCKQRDMWAGVGPRFQVEDSTLEHSSDLSLALCVGF